MATVKTEQKTIGQTINGMDTGTFQTIEKVKPNGALQARKQTSGTVMFYWRYSIGSISERVKIGIYDSTAPPKSLAPTAKGYSIAAAIESAQILAKKHHDNIEQGGRPALLAAELAAQLLAKQVKDDAAKAATAAKLDAEQHTLKNLLNKYCDHLQRLGRRSHADARSIFKLHVFQSWPDISSLQANQVSAEQVADMMRRLLELGKGRTSNKLRSYMRAAYQMARASRSKASIPSAFKTFNVVHNPAGETEPDESQNNPDKRPLTLAELRTYWQNIKRTTGFKGSVLRLHLLTGGQRIEQLVNLLTVNIGDDVITLFDSKGRPGKPPRPHTLPLVPAAAIALRECNYQGTYAVSTDCGKSHLSAVTLSHWACAAATEIPNFQTKRIRSGVETLLASARITSDVRGRLQSHGVSGVQARHYDGHDYLDEKKHALETLFNKLEAIVHNNVEISRSTQDDVAGKAESSKNQMG